MDLAAEAIDVDAGGQLRREDFDDDPAAERVLLGDEDPRHAAAAELAVDDIAGSQRRLEIVAQAHCVLAGLVESRTRAPRASSRTGTRSGSQSFHQRTRLA